MSIINRRKGARSMANVLDVAAYILNKKGSITTWKLQKLVYYSQAWSLVWDDSPIFNEPIEAWANGPVVRRLFEAHRGQFSVLNIPNSDINNLTSEEKATIDSVIEYYGGETSQFLSDLTHMEDPWRKAREGVPDDCRSDKVISLESMAEYYGSLEPDES